MQDLDIIVIQWVRSQLCLLIILIIDEDWMVVAGGCQWSCLASVNCNTCLVSGHTLILLEKVETVLDKSIRRPDLSHLQFSTPTPQARLNINYEWWKVILTLTIIFLLKSVTLTLKTSWFLDNKKRNQFNRVFFVVQLVPGWRNSLATHFFSSLDTCSF